VIGVHIRDSKVRIEPVHYVQQLDLELNVSDVALGILSKNLFPWKHEREHRAFVRRKEFINVKVRELIFGIHTPDRTRKLLSAIAKNFWDGIKIETLKDSDLEIGRAGKAR
jgi:hypothetical protein